MKKFLILAGYIGPLAADNNVEGETVTLSDEASDVVEKALAAGMVVKANLTCLPADSESTDAISRAVADSAYCRAKSLSVMPTPDAKSLSHALSVYRNNE